MAFLEAAVPEDLHAAAAMFSAAAGMGGRVVMMLIQNAHLKHGLEAQKAGAAVQRYAEQRPFIFRGDMYDLSVFWTKEQITPADIRQGTAGNRELFEAVLENFQQLQKDGYCHWGAGGINPTDKGLDKIYEPDFIKTCILREQSVYTAAEKAVKNAAVQGGAAAVSAGASVAVKAATDVVLGNIKTAVDLNKKR